MTHEHPPPTSHEAPDFADLVARLEGLEQSFARVSAALDELRERFATEIRTHRVVIVEHDGFERVVLDGAGRFGHLTVQARGDRQGSVAVEVFAADAVDGDPSHVGLALIDDGDVVAAVDVQAGHPAIVWVPGASDGQR